MKKILVNIVWNDNYGACSDLIPGCVDQRQLGHYLSGYRNPRKDKREIIINGLHKIGQEFLSVK